MRKPKQVIEFGVGHGTLVLAHGLWSSKRGKADPRPWLYFVDTSEHWIENTRWKVPAELEPYIKCRHDTVVMDGRRLNAAFLRRHLKRRWRFESDEAQGRHVFTLPE